MVGTRRGLGDEAVFHETVAVGAVGERCVAHRRILDRLLDAAADGVVVVLGLDDGQRAVVVVEHIVGVLALAASLWFARELVTSLTIACLLAFVLDPAVGFLTQRTRISRALSVNLVYFLGLGSLGTLPVIMLPRLLNEVALLFSDLRGFLSQIQDYIPQPIVILNWELRFETLLPDLTKILSESITAIPESAFHLIETTTKSLIWGLIVLVATYYLLMDWSRLRNQIFHQMPSPYQPDIRRVYREIRQIWKGYLRGNLVLMLIVGVVFTLAWTAIGLPGALLLGIIMGIFTIIPDLGPVIAAFLAILVALIEGLR